MIRYLVTQSLEDESMANEDLVPPTPTKKKKKKCQRGKSKQAVQPSVYVPRGEHGCLSRMTTSVFAFSAQIKQQTAVY